MRYKAQRTIKLFLCGDVMTGRGIDQALPHPGSPLLHESYVRDARDYIHLAEMANGPFPRPVEFDYIWGDALEELRKPDLDLRIINLETSITRNGEPWPEKGIHYRMEPRNVECLRAAGVDGCTLANNHTIDWGLEGFRETLQTLSDARIPIAGAGHNAAGAASPIVWDFPDKGRILFYAAGSVTSGIPKEWAAGEDRPGLLVLEELSRSSAERLAERLHSIKRPNDVGILSIHWGGNWGFDVPREQRRFARQLINHGFQIVHGHSSHHPKQIEFYRNGVILYGCGDFITDYEGITGYEAFRGDLALMYLIEVNPAEGQLVSMRLVPLKMKHFRLQHASPEDVQWLNTMLNEGQRRFRITNGGVESS